MFIRQYVFVFYVDDNRSLGQNLLPGSNFALSSSVQTYEMLCYIGNGEQYLASLINFPLFVFPRGFLSCL